MTMQKMFEVFIADSKSFCFSQSVSPGVFSFNEQALKYLAVEKEYSQEGIFVSYNNSHNKQQ